MKQNLTIRSFLIFLAISFSVPAILIFGLFRAYTAVQQARDQVRQMNQQGALLVQRDIAATLDKFKALSEGLASDVDLDRLRFKDETRAVDIMNLYPGFTLLLLNNDGVSVASYAPARQIAVGINYSDREYFQQARSGRKTVVSGAIMTRTRNTPAVVILVPLVDGKGGVRGYLGGGIPTQNFRSDYHLAPEQFALVLDLTGSAVSAIHSNDIEPVMQEIANGSIGEKRFRAGSVDEDIYLTQVDPIGWKVVVGVPHSYVIARARETISVAVLVALACTLIGAIVASIIAFSTVRGLNRIGQQAGQMSAADLRPIELSGNALYPREVRSLVGAFNNLLNRTALMRLAEFEAICQVADTIFISRSDGLITYVNEAGIRLFGDVKGHALREFVDEQTAASILTPVEPREWKGDAPVRRRNGEAFDGFISSTPLVEDGRLTAAVIIVQDITREKAEREDLVQSEKMITLGQLVAGTSHELNNPLAIVTGHADLLLHDDALDPDQRAKVESIRKNAQRAANIVHSLLAFARKRKPERTETDMTALVEAALQLKEYDLRTSGIQIEKELAQDLPRVYADANQIQQVLLNVLNNAQDAVLAATHPRWIRVRSEFFGQRVSITIEDSGPGISKDDLKKVFDPFFTTKPVGKGTGLGLSISYGIVREHAGEIDIRSEIGEGTQVSIRLPAYSALPAASPEPASTPAAKTGKRFLVVDDEADIASIIRQVLSRNGSTADTAGSLKEGLALAKKNHYDFVITDIKMPGGSGIDLYKQLCEINPAYRQRVFFLTGDTSNPSTIQFLERESLTYFEKPLNFQKMADFFTRSEIPTLRG